MYLLVVAPIDRGFFLNISIVKTSLQKSSTYLVIEPLYSISSVNYLSNNKKIKQQNSKQK